MPTHRQPKSLEGLSMGRVCQQLDLTCRRLQRLSQETSSSQILTLAKQTIRPYYVKSLPAILRSRVIEETSKMLYGPAPDGSTLISGPAPLYLHVLLLGQDIRQLKINLCCYYGCSHQTSLLKLLANEGIGIESLELARSALLRLDCKLLRSALLNMRNLKSLTLRNIANDAVLQVVGKTCPKLIVLDVSCSMQVTDIGLKQLLLQVELRDKITNTNYDDIHNNYQQQQQQQQEEPTTWSKLKIIISKFKVKKNHKSHKNYPGTVLLEYYETKNNICNTLKILNVANTGVTSGGVLLALAHVPNLESLADYNHMGRVVEIMNKGVINIATPFNLIQARSSRTTSSRLELLSQTCPRIEKLHISEPHHSPKYLCLFKNITSLSIHSIPAKCHWINEFYDYIKVNGQCLKELNLRVTQSEETPLKLDLRQIYLHCQSLITLTNDGASVVWLDGTEPSSLCSLKKIHLGRTVTAMTIEKIIKYSPALVSIHVHSCFDITNSHIESFIKNSLNCFVENLSCFYIYEANKLTANIVLDMFKHCKRLKKIGNLANWGLDCEGIKIIKKTLAQDNLNVELCPGSHWFWSNCIH